MLYTLDAMTTGFLYDERYLEHYTGAGHPECPERLLSTINYIETLPWFNKLKRMKSQVADIDWILTAHSLDYIKRVEETCFKGFDHLDSPDVRVSKKSFEIAKLAVGGVLLLSDQVIQGKISNGFALLRPPGHHAERNTAMGFCLFNNIAILAKYLQKRQGIDKVLILD